MTDTFLWHDYETFGASPIADRPAQFAALRTDSDLNPLGDPVVWYCSPADDVIPHPAACLITGITPQEARNKGVNEAEFARLIRNEMMQPGTCTVGYNNIKFDDGFTRHLFYRNLRDAYEREYRNGNSRWDLINLTRICYALRPDGIHWPEHEPGKPSFRLEDLSAANQIEHQGAHDALADVRATIDLARLIRRAQPRLYDWGLKMRDQGLVAGLLDPSQQRMILHTSSKIPAVRGCTSLVLPLVAHPNRAKATIVFDLMADPGPLIEGSADDIHDLVFTPSADLPEGIERLPLKLIASNQVPMVAPAATLRGVDTARIGLDPDRCERHRDRILAHLDSIQQKAAVVFSIAGDSRLTTDDPDRMLYGGPFFTPADRRLMSKILEIPPAQLGGHLWSFQDPRLDLMLFRFRARNYPEHLSLAEAEHWNRDRKNRLVDNEDPDYFTLSQFRGVLSEAREQRRGDEEAQRILDQLESWVLECGFDDL